MLPVTKALRIEPSPKEQQHNTPASLDSPARAAPKVCTITATASARTGDAELRDMTTAAAEVRPGSAGATARAGCRKSRADRARLAKCRRRRYSPHLQIANLQSRRGALPSLAAHRLGLWRVYWHTCAWPRARAREEAQGYGDESADDVQVRQLAWNEWPSFWDHVIGGGWLQGYSCVVHRVSSLWVTRDAKLLLERLNIWQW